MFKWKVKLVDRTDPLLIVNGQKCRGSVIYSKRLICIDKTLTDYDMPIVMRHEISHALLYSTQLDTKVNKKYTEEELCEFVAKYGEAICETTKRLLKDIDKYYDKEQEMTFEEFINKLLN